MSLRVRAATGIRWQGIASVTVQVLQAGVALLVASKVTPSEYGLVGIASVLFNAQYLVAGSLGLGLAIIQVPETERFKAQVGSAFLLMGCLGAVVSGVTFVLAPDLAGLFSQGFSHSQVTLVIRLMSIALLFAALTDIPQGLLERALSFKRRGVAELIAITAYVALTGLLLAVGLGVWSIIIARVLQSVLLCALFVLFCSPRPQLRWHASWSALAPLLRYGGYVGLSAVVAFLALNVDNVVVGHLAGAAALGVYTVAFALANMAPTFLTNTLAKVAFPSCQRFAWIDRPLYERTEKACMRSWSSCFR
jgi:O-antigen/teichoic acid export membrane protein